LIPVRISDSTPARNDPAPRSGSIHIATAKGRVELSGIPDQTTLRIVLEHLFR
jgi:hypothetical protein